MADNADIASEMMQNRLEGALAKRPRWIGIDMAVTDCDDCGHEIPQARRQAAPWATTCIECQGIREMKTKQRR
jgi:phage/conjugal plasmid C-4 type zinc finger TraR family protein